MIAFDAKNYRKSCNKSLFPIMYVLLLFIATAGTCYADWFTSVEQMQDLVRQKKDLISSLETYITTEEQKLKMMREVVSKLKEGGNSMEHDIGNPVDQFKLLRNLKIEFDKVYGALQSNSTKVLSEELEHKRQYLPDDSDIEGAAEAMMRLQDTYNLSIHGMAEGVIRDSVATHKLSADDCFAIGSVAFQRQDYYHAALWTMEAENRSRHGDSSQSRLDILNFLGFSLATMGNLYHAYSYLQEMIDIWPKNEDLQPLLDARERLQKNIDNYNGAIPPLSETPNLNQRYLYTTDFQLNYERLCRSEGGPVPHNLEKRLKCYNWDNQKPWIRIQPYKIEELWKSPHIVRFYDILSNTEIEFLIRSAKPELKRSNVMLDGKPLNNTGRISKLAWFLDSYDDVVQRISDRVTHLTGLDTEKSGEQLQIVNYGLGGHYVPHYDYLSGNIENRKVGDRIATMLFYLNDVNHGGATVFLTPKLAVSPIKGSAVFWFNLLSSGKPDERTKHAGCPVLVGSKWAANKWIYERNQEFSYPCKENSDNCLFGCD